VTPEERWTLMADGAPEVGGVDISKPDTAPPPVEEPAVEEPVDQEPVAKEPDAEVAEAVSTVAENDDESTDPPAKRWWTGTRVRRTAVLLLVVVAVAAIAVAAVLGWKLQQRNAVDTAADQAEQAARNYAVALTSVSSDNLDQNFADVLGGATGEFKDMYSQSSGQLRQLLVDNKATAEGTVIDSGIKSASTSKVEVLLFVDQTVTNTATPDPRVDRSRVVMTMEKIDGRWLAAEVDLP
jgi:Mce-associated membrane protein